MQNLIIVTLDDVNFWNLGFTGAMKDVTPNINQLAKESYVFHHAHCNIPFCQPSRMVLLTGLYPQNNGSTEFCPIKNSVPTLSSILKKLGCCTSIVGKCEHHIPYSSFGWDCLQSLPLGFNENDAKDFLGFKDFDSPFFALLNISVTHRPFGNNNNIYDGPLPNFLPDTLAIRKDVFGFFECLRKADSIIGEILEYVSEDDWFVLTSDHGFSFPYIKGNCYGISTNVPLIIRNKNILHRHDMENIVSHVDFLPTLADIFGFNGKFDGDSYFPILKNGGKSENHQYVYSQLNKMASGTSCRIRAINDKDHSYCVNFDPYYPGEMVDAWGWERCLREMDYSFFQRPVEEFHRNEVFNLIPDLSPQKAVFCRKLLSLMKKFRDPMVDDFTNLKNRGRMLVEMSVPPLL